MRRFPPERIVCLTEETVETLYLLGEQDRIVGVSGYAVRPAQVRREKPRVSAFTRADIPKILALAPDLVLTFSDLQADIVADLVRAGIAVHAFNHRDVAGILAMIRTVGALVDARDKAETLARGYEGRLARMAAEARGRPRPRVYFEEWDGPLISGIGWVSELVSVAGGEDVFPELAAQAAAKDRIVAPEAVVAAAPDVILASWCGKKVVPARIAARPGWDAIPAVRENRIVEIKSPLILQPGPAALSDGLDAIRQALAPLANALDAAPPRPPWPLSERHRAVLLKVPDEGWIEGSRIDGRCLDVLLRRGWIRRVHVDGRRQSRRDGYQRTPAARAALFPGVQPTT
ncbi:ABC-type transporter, periplasmic subunit [Methylorubrum extorquens DSM 13060]|jgi:iron complex transport system substrate-binding protein|uniref:ABC-type transporter, periplasmic subunit n=1 Tax=Methylorubrum extorquens DSM 13060 TaxID=882800 RepID=H1KJ49_METEX|nr:ABC-type transporter, periplasmic subunit [Methylorubrum extorquens DSM 13060]